MPTASEFVAHGQALDESPVDPRLESRPIDVQRASNATNDRSGGTDEGWCPTLRFADRNERPPDRPSGGWR
ncbi:hypothetical protein D3261_08270 [Halococcus sp. IIIV-5B]|nr:hypothetical protein D3261_08270 [Halococcus sp. IIIV-5B]